MQIAQDTVVSLDVQLSDLHGNLIQRSAEAVQYLHGGYDGIFAAVEAALQGKATGENIEVRLASHIGFGVNAAALWVVADRLAQTEGQFRQFDRSGPFAIAYAPPEQAQS